MKYEEAKKLIAEFDHLISNLTVDVAPRAVEIIGLIGSSNGYYDDETAHYLEDKLHQAALRAIGGPLATLVLSTNKLDFSRWYA